MTLHTLDDANINCICLSFTLIRRVSVGGEGGVGWPRFGSHEEQLIKGCTNPMLLL